VGFYDKTTRSLFCYHIVYCSRNSTLYRIVPLLMLDRPLFLEAQ
jgi:hypothetical protein